MPVDGGYRGGALNLASRLCGMAAPGQILASETVVGLARKVDGLRFVKRRPARLKGMQEPVPVIEAVPDPPLPPLPVPRPARRSFVRRYRRPLLAAAAMTAALAIALPFVLRSSGRASVPQSVISVPRSFVGLLQINPSNNQLVRRIRTDSPPSAALANGFLWVGGANGIDQVDPQTGRFLSHIPVTGGVPGGVSGNTSEGLWIARTGFLWLVVGANTIFKINPANAKVVDRIPYSFPSQSTAYAAAAGEGALWIADPHALVPEIGPSGA